MSARSVIVLLLCLRSAMAVGQQWQTRQPQPTGVAVHASLYTGARFILTGAHGLILSSSDGAVWAAAESPVSASLHGAVWTGSLAVVVGESGTLLTSTEGLTWTARSSPLRANWRAVTWDGTRLIAVGEAGAMARSTNGIDWTLVRPGVLRDLRGVAASASRTVAVGEQGAILTSTDLATWTSVSPITNEKLRAVAFSGSRWVAVGDRGVALTSTNGTTWSLGSSGVTTALHAVRWDGTQFLSTGDEGVVLTSPDGLSWTPRSAGLAETLRTVTSGGGQFVVAGEKGTVATSTDATAWTPRSSGPHSWLHQVVYDGGQFIAAGAEGMIRTSADGVSWQTRTSGTSASLHGLAVGGGKRVAVGDTGVILSSNDGAAWSTQTSGVTNPLRGVTYTGSQFVAVGRGGRVLTSANGTSWAAQTLAAPSPQLLGVASNSSMTVAVGEAGVIRTSSNATSWTTRTSGVTTALESVAWNGSRFVTVGASGVILSSEDGSTWTQRSLPASVVAPFAHLRSIVAQGSTFKAVGSLGLGPDPVALLLESIDGITWTSGSIEGAPGLDGIAAASGAMVAVGEEGTILNSAPLILPTVDFVQASSSVSEAGAPITVQVSLSSAPSGTVTVPFAVAGAVGDVSLSSNQFTITSGQLTGSITITLINDSLDEQDEGLVLTLQSPTGATLGSATVYTLTITDDDTSAMTFNFSTIAGKLGQGTANGTGPAAQFHFPGGAILDNSGNLFVADTYNHCIRRIVVASGATTTFVGAAGLPGAANGIGTAAQFRYPIGLARDAAGNLYVADSGNHVIRKVTSAGDVTTFVGTSGSPDFQDGVGPAAAFHNPQGIAYDGVRNRLYVADTDNHAIREIAIAGAVVTTAAGSPDSVGSGDGSSAQFRSPGGVAVAGDFVYVADSGNHVVRRIDAVTRLVTTIAGGKGLSGWVNATGTAARFNQPQGICSDGNGVLYVADLWNGAVRRVSATNQVTTLGPSTLLYPRGLCSDGAGGVFVLDTGLHAVRQITSTGILSLVAGRVSTGSEDGLGRSAGFHLPQGMTTTSEGIVYIADTKNHTIRRVGLNGAVTLFAGAAGVAGSANGSALDARFNGPAGIASDFLGNLYVAEIGGHTIRFIRPDGFVSTLAGNYGKKGTTNGAGAAARFNEPLALSVDREGNVFVADSKNHTIRKISPSGVVSTFAGGAGLAGYKDATGTVARFNTPTGIDIDSLGSVFVADRLNACVRKITVRGIVTTFAGQPGVKGNTDGTGTLALFGEPAAVTVDGSNHLIVSDLYYNTLRRIMNPSQEVSTVAGQAWLADQDTLLHYLPYGGDSDGVNSIASFYHPTALAFDAPGTLYVLDRSSNTLRAGSQPASGPTITAHPATQVVAEGGTATFSVTAAGATSYQWRKNGAAINGATLSSYMVTNVEPDDEGSYSVAVSNGSGTSVSHAALLRVVDLPVITKQPANVTVLGGQPASLSVTATGLFLSYQWKKNGTDLNTPSATTPTLQISSATAADNDNYSVVVSNAAGSVASQTVRLTVNIPPVITIQPLPAIVPKGVASVSLFVATTGTNLTYRWYKNNVLMSAVTNPSAATPMLNLASVKSTDAASYKVIVSNAVGSQTSATVTLVVVDQASVTTLNVVEGKDAVMSPLAYGSITGYQWRYNGSNINAAGSPVKYVNFNKKSLTVKSVVDPLHSPPGDEGAYTCVISSAGGSLESGPIQLRVTIRPVVDPFAFSSPIMVSEYFSKTVTAQNEPTAFTISGLPKGLTYNAATGTISGRALVSDSFPITVKASNAAGASLVGQQATLLVQPLLGGVTGTYTGRVQRHATTVLGGDLGGRVAVTVSSVGQLTGSLSLGAKNHPLKGALDTSTSIANPTATLMIDQKAPLQDLRVTFTITTAARGLSGQVEEGAIVSGVFTPVGTSTPLQAWLPTDAPGTYTGNYTFACEHSVPGEDKPQGYSNGGFKVGATGTVSGTLRMADNSVVALSGPVGQGGNVALFKLLYTGSTGSVHGVLSIDAANGHRLDASTLGWTKKAQSSGRAFKTGFAPLDLAVFGRKYVIPASGVIAMGLASGPDNAKLKFSDGLAPSPDTRLDVDALEVKAGNPAVVLLPSSVTATAVAGGRGKVSLKIVPGSGSIFTPGTTAGVTGSFTLVDQDPTTVTVKLVTRTVNYYATTVDDGVSSAAYGFFLLQELPSTSPAYTTSTSPYHSGKVVLSAINDP